MTGDSHPQHRALPIRENAVSTAIWLSMRTKAKAIISSDGRYLAYADRLGIHVQTIDTGETTTIPQPEGFDAKNFNWSIADWFPSNKEFLANAEPAVAGQNFSIWVVGLNSTPRKLKE